MTKRTNRDRLLWNSEADGTAVRAELNGEQVYVDKQHCLIPLTIEERPARSSFRGKWPVCKSYHHHRWDRSQEYTTGYKTCKRCSTRQRVKNGKV